MHLNFVFTARQVLWTLTFAAQLVLLVVLLGRDRLRRFPWFTASIALFAVRLLAEDLLAGRMAMITLQEIFLTLADLAALAGLVVVVELGHRSFAGANRKIWAACTAALAAVAVGILIAWGPWPANWHDFANNSLVGILTLMQLFAQKADTLVDLLTVGLGLLVILLGRRFKAGWRTHPQMIVIGLSTAALAQIAVQITGRTLSAIVQQHHDQYERIVALWGKVLNANKVVYIAVLVWWIVWLWFDEPGAAPAAVVVPEAETADLAATDPDSAEPPAE